MAEKENTEEVENIEVKENQEKVLHSNEEYDELNDRYKRVLAEFENYKKRSSKEITRKLHRTNKKKSRKEISYD